MPTREPWTGIFENPEKLSDALDDAIKYPWDRIISEDQNQEYDSTDEKPNSLVTYACAIFALFFQLYLLIS